ncbi:MAG TPA: MerR family transcriptional regulator [Acidimicrobiales bacterium]|nr:MerR family transcriptional regulator [Acidimicrobiales bacterium]
MRPGDGAGRAEEETPAPAATALLPIGRVAETLAVSERTLRYYEERGLVVPAEHRPGRCRRYSEADVARLAHIRELQEVMGYSLEEIDAILSVEDRFDAIRSAYRQGQDPAEQGRLLEEALALLEGQRERVRAKLDRLGRIMAGIDTKLVRCRELQRQVATEATPAPPG